MGITSSMRIAVFGGTGFVGCHIVQRLHAAGYQTSLLVRPDNEAKSENRPSDRTVSGDLSDAAAVESVLAECDAAIYLVGLLREFPRRGITFREAHYEGVVRVADAARQLGVSRFLLMSSNGVEARAIPYQVSKHDAERYALESGIDTTIFRPSVIFGDPQGRMEFATQLFEDLVSPPIPAIGFYKGLRPSTGPVLMSPVHIDDVADCFVAALDRADTVGRTYELGGPDVLSWQEMLQRVAAAVGRKKLIVPMPIGLMRLAATFLDWLPFFPVTRGQLIMLQQGNTCTSEAIVELLGREPRRFDRDGLSYLNNPA